MSDDLKEIEQPNTLEEAFTYLDKSLQDKSLFKDTLEANVLGMTHFSMGIWMRNNWHLWWHKELAEKHKDTGYPQEKPALVKFFNEELSIHHADDMSSIIILSYHRYLNGKELDIPKQVKRYHDFWLKNDGSNNESEDE